MKKQIFLAAAIALFLVFALNRSQGQDPGTGIQGTWRIVAIEDDGKKQPLPKDPTVIVTKDQFTIKDGGGYTYKLDASKSPKWIDFSVGDLKIQGIYDLKDDNLRICLGHPNGVRSTAFETAAKGNNDVLMVLKRIK